MTAKLGILADIHANALALAAVLGDARRRGVTRFVNLGDVFYGPLAPRATFEMLADVEMVATVSGNQDRQIAGAAAQELAQNRTLAFVAADLGAAPIAWLRSLPATATWPEAAAASAGMLLCHGTPHSDTVYLLEDVGSGHPRLRDEAAIVQLLGGTRAPLVLCGHTHIPRVVRLADGTTIVNPGSVGLPAYRDDAPVAHRMQTFAPHACYAILEPAEPARLGWNVTLHHVAYDWLAAADQARKLGREDWAEALATGRVG